METAAPVNSPVIIQFSHSGSAFIAGKGVGKGDQASILGSLAGAAHVNTLAAAYGARVILHTDHCAKDKLGWVDGLLEIGEQHFAEQRPAAVQLAHARPLRGAARGERGDVQGVPQADVGHRDDARGRARHHRRRGGRRRQHRRQTRPTCTPSRRRSPTPTRSSWRSATASRSPPPSATCTACTSRATCSCARRSCRPARQYIAEKFGTGPQPVDFVFHGGSGSEPEKIAEAISYGVVQDEHRHRPAVGALGRHPQLRGRVPRLPAGPDRQPQRARTSRTRSSTTRGSWLRARRGVVRSNA